MTSVPPDDKRVIRINIVGTEHPSDHIAASIKPLAAMMSEYTRVMQDVQAPLLRMLSETFSDPETQARMQQWSDWVGRNRHLEKNERIGNLEYHDLVALGQIRPPGKPGAPRLEDDPNKDWRALTKRIIELRSKRKFSSEEAAAAYVGIPYSTFRNWKERLRQVPDESE